MMTIRSFGMIMLLAFVGPSLAGGYYQGVDKSAQTQPNQLYDFAEVIGVQPVYHQRRVSRPVRECWDEPVYHTRHRSSKSAGGLLAGGVIGGIIGHQLGHGRNKRLGTAVGTLIGAHIGHQTLDKPADSHTRHEVDELLGYEEHCQTQHEHSYQEILRGYDVTYRYRGREYHLQMPYDPGKQIKIRLQFTPVI